MTAVAAAQSQLSHKYIKTAQELTSTVLLPHKQCFCLTALVAKGLSSLQLFPYVITI